MNSTQHFDLPTPARRTVLAGVSGSSDDTIGFRLRAAGSSFFWAMQLLPYQRREAMYALYAFCREVDDIADGDASRSLKQTGYPTGVMPRLAQAGARAPSRAGGALRAALSAPGDRDQNATR
jgi:phytoene/squalene synthetase